MEDKKILLVAESARIRNISRSIVERADVDIRSASTVEEAENAVEEGGIDCIVVDCEFSSCEAVVERLSGSLVGLPSIVFNVSEDKIGKSLENGFDEVVSEDSEVKYDLLVKRIDALVESGSSLSREVFQGNELIEGVFEAAPVGIYLQDDQGRVLLMNDRISEMSEELYEELDTQREGSLLEEEEKQKIREADEKAMRGETVEIPEIKVVENGRERYFRGIKKGFRPEGVADTFVLGTLVEVTDRKEREEAMQEILSISKEISGSATRSEIGEIAVETIKETLDMNVTAFYENRGDKLVSAYMTEECRQVIGELPELDTGDSIAGDVFKSGEPRFFEDLEEVEGLYNPDTVMGSEVIIPVGGHGVVISGSTEKKAFDGEKISLAELFCSIVESGMDRAQREKLLRRKEESLREKNEKLNKFASIISHDLRNPLNVATGYLDIAEETGSSEDFDEIRSALNRMEEIIETVLKITKDDENAELSDFSLKEVAEEAWSFVENEDARLVIESDPVIYADRGQVQHILENLFSNSIEHNEGEVTVRIGETENGFYVEDNGEGVNAGEEIFEYGYSRDGGTGLGLSIVKDIVEQMDWKVKILESREGGLRIEFKTQSSRF